MKTPDHCTPAVRGLAAGLLLVLVGCASVPEAAAPAAADRVVDRALAVLETNCVHCHGEQRLLTMPAVTDLRTLAALTGPGRLIVPGQPESSRFFTVVTLSDAQPGAMPPTGHALAPAEVAALREWIRLGAALPPGNRPLQPRGQPPRST